MQGNQLLRCRRWSWGAIVPLIALWLVTSCADQNAWDDWEYEPDGGSPPGHDGGLPPGEDGGVLPPDSDCSALTQGIYVITRNGHLVRFDPEFSTFDQAIPLCPEVGYQALAVSIDRSATAWVLFDNGLLYRATVDDGVCSVTDHELLYPAMDWYWWATSMSFVSDSDGSADETLFYSTGGEGGPDGTIAGYGCERSAETGQQYGCSARVGVLETNTGSADLLPESIDTISHLRLTGTGSGELWGLWIQGEPWVDGAPEPSSYPVIGQVNKATGAVISQLELRDLEDDNYWWWNDWYNGGGLAFWGGWFYLFMRPSDGHSTRIWRVNPATEVVEEVMHESGLDIVGAGVSTCAPVDLY